MTVLTDWIEALSTFAAAGITGIAARVGLATFKNQRTVSDVSLAFNIFGEINRYWDKLSENPGSYEYNMGQVLAHFEIAAALFNKRILSPNANVILGDHIIEVFSQIRSSTEGKILLEKCCSSTTTFLELQKFAAAKMPQALNAIEFRS